MINEARRLVGGENPAPVFVVFERRCSAPGLPVQHIQLQLVIFYPRGGGGG